MYENRRKPSHSFKTKEWMYPLFILVIVAQARCDLVNSKLSVECHNCAQNNSLNEVDNDFIDDVLDTIEVISNKMIAKSNKTEEEMEEELIKSVDETLKTDYYEIADGFSIQPVKGLIRKYGNETARSMFGPFSFERKLVYRIRNFLETHVLSISLPKAARLFGIRSFGLKKFLVPVLIGAQVLKGVLVAMFLPSILGSFGKIVGKGLSHLSASSSQASFPPAVEEQPYEEDSMKDVSGYESDPQGVYAYPQDPMHNLFSSPNDINGLADMTMSRYGPGGAKVSYLPTKNTDYYKNQVSNTNYKVFHKIPASSMILSNYDPFYSPLLSRLDGIFARLGLAPEDNDEKDPSSYSSLKLESCREQLICLMYASPAKYAPYSNLVSAQLSRELNELRRPTSDNAEILRFFRYMRAARRGQEGVDCVGTHPGCAATAEPEHTMIAAYHDINKLVTARKLQ